MTLVIVRIKFKYKRSFSRLQLFLYCALDSFQKLTNMDLTIPFFFRNKTFSCNCYVDISDDPCFIFVMLIEKDLIREFGVDVTIKTDCITILPRIDDYAELIELREAIFKVFKTTPEFMVAKNKRMLWDKLQKKVYKNPLSFKIKALETHHLN